MTGKLTSLQVLRFLAALGVVQAHAALVFGHDSNEFGAIGVDVFFVISGFIITGAARSAPQRFLQNRAVRVLPLYYLFLAPWLLSVICFGHLEWRELVASVFLWPALDVYSTPYLLVGWTLCYELLFYLGVWLILRGVRGRYLIAAYVVAVAMAALTGAMVWRYLGSPLIAEFLFGVVLAFWRPSKPWLGAVALASGVAAVVWFAFAVDGGIELIHYAAPGGWLRPIVWGIPAALLVFGAIQLEPLFKSPLTVPLVFLGDASYSLYLSHLYTNAALLSFGVHPPPTLAILVCVVVGAGVYAFIERPLLRLVRGALKQAGETRSGRRITTGALSGAPDPAAS